MIQLTTPVSEAAVRALKVGDALDPATQMGPAVSETQMENSYKYIDIARDAGGRIITGGERLTLDNPGWYVQPTLIADTDATSQINNEEVFGPVLVVIAYEDDDDAVRIANNSIYWLSGAVFGSEEHVEVEATWGIYQRIVAAYREPDKKKAKEMMHAVIETITSGVPAALVEIRKLGRTMKQRAADILAFFDRPGTSNGPTEAINGRLEHLRGSALGFRNLTHYVARSLLEAGGFRPHLHP